MEESSNEVPKVLDMAGLTQLLSFIPDKTAQGVFAKLMLDKAKETTSKKSAEATSKYRWLNFRRHFYVFLISKKRSKKKSL